MLSFIPAKLKFLYSATHERTRLVQKNIILSFLIKGLSIAIGLVFVPLTIDYIDAERYGIWLTLSSIIIWFNFFDLGLGNGLRNKLVEAIAKNNIEEERRLISTTYVSLSIIAVAIIAIYLCLMPFLEWDKLLNVSSVYRQELRDLALITVIMFSLQFVLQLINSINSAHQKVFLTSLVFLIGSIFSLLFILILRSAIPGNILLVGTAMFAGNLLALILFTIHFFVFTRPDLLPGIKYFSRNTSKGLLTLGGKFFIIQISAIVQYQTTNVLISRYFSSIQVTEYNIAYKLFSIFIMAFSIIISPLWSAVTDAQTKGDYEWIKRTERKLLFLWSLMVIAGLIILVGSQFIYKLWIGDSIQIPFSISLGVLLYTISVNFGMIYVYILNGLGRLKTQYYLSIITMLYFIPLSYLLSVKLSWGVLGICIALILANINGLIAAPIEYRRFIKARSVKH
ncbi:lipopolysaccharide biosynthesis protein [Terrimonas alba]|uniref:lipopolysaccharide biosynthesis protein n=1 Tax=Terrimonas alba TaxID=3349636 RepID=UPI0035F3811E